MKMQTKTAVAVAAFVVLLASYAMPADLSNNAEPTVLPYSVATDLNFTKGLSTPRYILSSSQRTNQELAVLSSYAIIDYTQSVAMFYGSDGFYEMNPVLGKRPTRQSMALFGLIGVSVFYALAKTLPDPWKQIFVDSVIASEQMNIEDNRRVHQGWNNGGPPVRGRSFNGVPIVISFRF
jgi:hypothetical protein